MYEAVMGGMMPVMSANGLHGVVCWRFCRTERGPRDFLERMGALTHDVGDSREAIRESLSAKESKL